MKINFLEKFNQNKYIKSGLVGIVLSSSLILNSGGYSEESIKIAFTSKKEVYECFEKAKNIESVPDWEGSEYWQTPTETKEKGSGDCEDYAFYLYYLLERKDIQSEVIFGNYHNGEKWYGHMWVEYKDKGVVWILDPTLEKIIKKNNTKNYMEFKHHKVKYRDKVRDFIKGYKKDPDFRYPDMVKA